MPIGGVEQTRVETNGLRLKPAKVDWKKVEGWWKVKKERKILKILKEKSIKETTSKH